MAAPSVALPELPAEEIPILSNPHTRARPPGEDFQDLTLRRAGMFGTAIQSGASDIVRPEMAQFNEQHFLSHKYKVFLIKMLYFMFLVGKQEDVTTYIIPGAYHPRIEWMITNETIKSTVSKIQAACFGDGNVHLYNYIYQVLLDIQRRITTHNTQQPRLQTFTQHPKLEDLDIVQQRSLLKPYFNGSILITMLAPLKNTINFATITTASTVPGGGATWPGKLFLHARGLFQAVALITIQELDMLQLLGPDPDRNGKCPGFSKRGVYAAVRSQGVAFRQKHNGPKVGDFFDIPIAMDPMKIVKEERPVLQHDEPFDRIDDDI